MNKCGWLVIYCWLFWPNGIALAQDHNFDSLAQAFVGVPTQKQTEILSTLSTIARDSPAKAISTAYKILKYTQHQGQPDTLGLLYISLAHAYEAFGHYDSVVYCLERAVNIYRQHNPGDLLSLAEALNFLGTIYDRQGNYEQALESYHQCLAIYEKLENEEGLGTIYCSIGTLYTAQKKFYKALNYYEKGLKASLAAQDTINIAYLYSNIGTVWGRDFDSLDVALEYYHQSLEWANQQHDRSAALLPLYGITHIKIRRGQLDESLYNAYYILDLALCQQDKNDKLQAWQLVAHVQWARSEYDTAIFAATQAYNLSVANKDLLEIGESAKLLADYYSTLREFEKAHEYRSVQLSYQDSVYSVETSKAINKLEQMRANTKIELLEKDNAINKAHIEWQTTYLVGATLIALLLLGGFILVYIFYQHRKTLSLQLANHKEELEANNEQLQVQQLRLQDQNQDLCRLNQLKNKLLSIISHDFRSPLNSLKGIINVLDSGGLSPEEIPQIFGSLATTVENTANMLDNLLKWTSSQMSGVQVIPEKLALAEIVAEVMGTQAATAEKKGVRLLCKVGPEHIVYADAETIRLVVRNLISNAIKFTEQNDTITVKAQPKKQQMVVSVTDTGVGISPEDMSKLFQLNHHTTEGTANEKGTGLGLTLCQEFVEKNGGKIWVESELKKGTTFYFTLVTDPQQFPAASVVNELVGASS